ncbi:MAG: integrase core domain-containing protein [Planctomycetaceae bacterium]
MTVTEVDNARVSRASVTFDEDTHPRRPADRRDIIPTAFGSVGLRWHITKRWKPSENTGNRRLRTNASPKAGPNLNGRCERFIETIKLECLQKFIVFGKRHLDYIVREFEDYYNHHRSHMERDRLPPMRTEPDEVKSVAMDGIDVRSFVGGLVKGFVRKAA